MRFEKIIAYTSLGVVAICAIGLATSWGTEQFDIWMIAAGQAATAFVGWTSALRWREQCEVTAESVKSIRAHWSGS